MGRIFRRRVAVTIVAILVITPLVFLRAINSPRFQARMLQLASDHSPWQFSVTSLDISAWHMRISVTGLEMLQRRTKHHLKADSLSIQFNPWIATIAQLGIREIKGENIILDLSHGDPTGPQESKRLDWSRILLLKNLRISDAHFNTITVLLPENKQIQAKDLTLSFLPNFLRQINLTITSNDIKWVTGDVTNATISKFNLNGETNVSHWKAAAPYVNDISGKLKIDDATIGQNIVEFLRTEVKYSDLHLEVSKMDMLLNAHQLTGSGSLDLIHQKYAAHIDIPQPIEIREDWDKDMAISLGGTLQGKINVEGEKFDLKEGHGKFDIALTQVPKKEMATAVPILITAKGTWDKGTMTIAPSTIKVQDGVIQLSGKIDLANPSLNLPLTVRDVPLPPVFGRFNDENFHPIGGVATGQGTIHGWGKSFVVDGVADVVNATYVPMVTERAHVTVKATSDKLSLNGDIYQRGRIAGRCDMSLTFAHTGIKGSDNLDLKASLDHIDLAPVMKAFDWTGNAVATFEIKGPTSRYVATGKATVTDGVFASIPYKSITTVAHLVPQKIDFDTTTIEVPRFPPFVFTQPLTLRFSPGMFAFDGHPMPNLSMKGKYRYVGKLWQIDEIAITDRLNPDWRVVLSGTSSNSNLNLHVHGTADAAILNVMRETFRDVTGPAAVDVHLAGPAGNPAITGNIAMHDNTLLLRGSPYRAENLEGTLRFTGHEIHFENIHGTIEDGTFTVQGDTAFDHFTPGTFNVHISGKDIRYAAMDGALRLEMDTELSWTGTPKHSMLSGEMMVQDGLYAKDFNIFDQFTGNRIQRTDIKAPSTEADSTLGLNLRIKNNGEIRVRNNAADVALSANVTVTGTEAKPVVIGSIQSEDGVLSYVGLKFNIARGLVEFRGSLDNPYIEFVGERDMYSSSDQNYVVNLTLTGPLNNLKYDLSSSPPQDRTSLISLLLTGATPEEQRNRIGPTASGSQYAAGQVGAALAQPVASAIHLDTIRLESGMTTSLLNNTVSPTTNSGAQRLYLGKRLSERLNLGFSTDVGGTNPQQSVVAEYMLTDYLLIKGGQNSNQNFGFNFTLRFRERE